MKHLSALSVCILIINLVSLIISVPLSSTDTASEKSQTGEKHLLTLKNIHKFEERSPESSTGKGEPAGSRTATEDTKNATKSDTESDAMADLMSITDSMEGIDEFSSDDSIDYDGMENAKSVKLIPEEDTGSSTSVKATGQLTDLAFRQMHERAQFIRISEVKESILDKLRLLAPPNITEMKLRNQLKRYPSHIIPELPDQRSDMQQDDSRRDDFHAKISTVIQFASEFPKDKKPELYPTESIVYFSLPLTVGEKNVQKATLMIYIATPEGEEGKKIRLSISDTLYTNKPFINHTVTLLSRGHWEHIDIAHQVRTWASDDSVNYGLFVTALLNGENVAYLNEDPLEAEKERMTLDGDITARPHRTPLLKIILDADEQGRYKRSFNEVPLSCDIKDRDNRCCRYKFVIDFQEMGKEFDFIIQPRRYLANYCAGSCPTYYLPKDGNSKMLMGYSKPKIQRCCTPISKKPLTILYNDEKGSMMLGEIPEMSIEKCYCS